MRLGTNLNWTNGSEIESNATFGDDSLKNGSGAQISYWSLVLLLIPTCTLFGNLLVIISVVTRRNLHSPINYFILGLAVADLCVALAVMPFAVYVEFNEDWELGTLLCDLYCAADVTCSTASIFLLTVISFDRYVAATQPIRYANSAKGIGRVAIINLAVWLVSMLIASPMVLGLNNVPERDLFKCMFYNADFIIYSSTGSFCIPLVIIIYLYARIYCVIRRRGKFAQQRRDLIVAAARCSIATEGNEKPLLSKGPRLPSVAEYSQSTEKNYVERNDVLSSEHFETGGDCQNQYPNGNNNSGAVNADTKKSHSNRENVANFLSPTACLSRGGKSGVRCSSLRVRRSVTEVRENGDSSSERKPVFRSYSGSDAQNNSSTERILESPGKTSYDQMPIAKIRSPKFNWPRRFSLPQRRQKRLKARPWSLSRSINITREARRSVDASKFANFDNRLPILQYSSQEQNGRDRLRSRSADVRAIDRLAATVPKDARHSSMPVATRGSVAVISSATVSSDEHQSTSIVGHSRETKSSFSSMISNFRKVDNRKRMSEGGSPLLRSTDNRLNGFFRSRGDGKRSMDEAAQAARHKWLRRLSTRLILWRVQRENNGDTTDTTTSIIIDREGIKQPLLFRNSKRLKTPRKSTSKIQRKEKKATKTLAIVLGIFLVCWLPFFTLNLLNAVCMKLKTLDCQVGFLPFFLTTWLGYTNSLMNPIIYTIFNADFRRAFKEILCSRFFAHRPGRRA